MQPASRVLQFYWTRVHRNNFTWAVPVHIVYGIRVQQGSLFDQYPSRQFIGFESIKKPLKFKRENDTDKLGRVLLLVSGQEPGRRGAGERDEAGGGGPVEGGGAPLLLARHQVLEELPGRLHQRIAGYLGAGRSVLRQPGPGSLQLRATVRAELDTWRPGLR